MSSINQVVKWRITFKETGTKLLNFVVVQVKCVQLVHPWQSNMFNFYFRHFFIIFCKIFSLKIRFKFCLQYQQRCSPRCTWFCWRIGRAGWGSSAGARPRWAPRSVSSEPHWVEGGPWESFDEGEPVANSNICELQQTMFWSYGCKYNILKGNGPSELIPIRASTEQASTKERLQRLQTQPWVAPSSFL